MKTFLSHMTALALLRRLPATLIEHARNTQTHVPSSQLPGTRTLRPVRTDIEGFRRSESDSLALSPYRAFYPKRLLLDRGLIGAPLDVLVSSQGARSKRAGVHVHTCSVDLPHGSFLQLFEEVYVSSPELVFLQLAPMLTFGELVLLGLELCGTYALVPGLEHGHLSRRGSALDADVLPGGAITSIGKMNSFAQRAVGVHGRKQALQALRYLADGSDSPAESVAAILLTLPRRRGGFGLGSVLLNPEIRIDRQFQRATSTGTRKPDILFRNAGPKGNVAIDYNGKRYHNDPWQIARDNRHRNELVVTELQTFTLDSDILMHWDDMERFAAMIARALGKHPRVLRQDERERERTKRSALRSCLLPYLYKPDGEDRE